MTRPQKCKRGLRLGSLIRPVFSCCINDPTVEMQKGIKTRCELSHLGQGGPYVMTRPQKCKRGLRPHFECYTCVSYSYDDPTAEMQKGIKTC